ncbi:MAG: DEAD/DEAH box helicase [Acidobacteriota bacterium]
MGDKTIAIAAFEGNNLVLVDEGHRGASSGEQGAWMRFRNALCEKGFSFEYSATFGQAVKGNNSLTDLYAKNVLFDYSYRYFYRDGFGKDYQILNLDPEMHQNHLDLYLVACLLSFYQQQRLFRERGATFRPFNIEKPLWIFVGGRVTAKLAKKDASDIVQILLFLGRYTSDRATSVKFIEQVLNQGLVTANAQNLFAGRFGYLNGLGLAADQIFDDTMATLFHAPGGGQLYVENLKGATGEVALRLGAENEAFGVINVGDDAELVKLCSENGLATGEKEFSGSLFHTINDPDSSVNVLIGAKKFMEGWSSWRVSTMGLMNVGKGEGAQIIQLFGRGVRLKGYDMTLKRSGKTQLPDGIERPKHVQLLETLGIFGIHAAYMEKFRDFLKYEELPVDDDQLELVIPVLKNLGTQKLKTIRLKKMINGVSTEFGDAFRKLAPIPTLRLPDVTSESENRWLRATRVEVNWYPRIQAMKSQGTVGGDAESLVNIAHLSSKHVAFLDVDRIWFELERFKAERGWYNFNVPRSAITQLLDDRTWYDLLIPQEELGFDSFERVRQWEEIAIALLKKYMERFYRFAKREWEEPHLEYQELTEHDPNFLRLPESMQIKDGPNEGYRILIDRSEEEIIQKLTELKELILRGELKPWEFHGIRTIQFAQHLYQPLLYLEKKIIEVMPVALNEGEYRFVEDIKKYYDANPQQFQDRQLYLLRNLSRGRGVGFFEAGNFHPDFILWVVTGGRQHVTFVDPKGIRNLGPNDDKLRFHKTVKGIEKRLGDPNVVLDSFIVSNTPSAIMQGQWGMKKAEMNERHIVFQNEDHETYVGRILNDM